MSFVQRSLLVALAIASAVSNVSPTEAPVAETHQYQTEVAKLLDILAGSVYPNKDMFIRELISNASDALDKLRMRSLEDQSVLSADPDLRITVIPDAANHTLTILDTGIGMTKAELAKNLGTIAHSGTAKLLEEMRKANKPGASNDTLIGQFGVGFYSSFLVADRVLVRTKSPAEDKQWAWESSAGDTTFTIREDTTGQPIKRGTAVTLYLKDDSKDVFSDAEKLKGVITKYAGFFTHPIYLVQSVEKDVAVESSEEAEDQKENEKGKKDTDGTSGDKDSKKKVKTEKKTVTEHVQMNPDKSIWERREVPDAEYISFYKKYFNEKDGPIAWSHFNGTGEVDFTSLTYIRSTPAHSMFTQRDSDGGKNIHNTMSLRVRNVLIGEYPYTEAMSRFMCGFVESPNLPINISRDTLQKSGSMDQIRRKTINKALDKLAEVAADDDKSAWNKFYSNFSSDLKLAVIQDEMFRKRLSSLLSYSTTKQIEPKKRLSELIQEEDDDTVEDDDEEGTEASTKSKKKEKKPIYFLAGRDVEELKNSPLLERLKAAGTEVILATEPLDEHCFLTLHSYEGHTFRNVAKEQSNEVSSDTATSFTKLFEFLKDDVLKGEVSDVVLSDKLIESPCIVVAPAYGMSGHMLSMMESQVGAGKDPMFAFAAMQKPILEINPKNRVILVLKERVESGSEADKAGVRDIIRAIFDAAMLQSGYLLKDSKRFIDSVHRLIIKAFDASSKAPESTPLESSESVAKPEATGSEVVAGKAEEEKDEL